MLANCSALRLLQVFPKCGDGVNFVVALTPVDGGEVQILHEAEYEQADKPTRQRLHFYLDKLSTGAHIGIALGFNLLGSCYCCLRDATSSLQVGVRGGK